jgi:hypothetical protein
MLKAGDDATAAAYFPLSGLPDLAFQSHARLIAKAGRSCGDDPGIDPCRRGN